MKNLKIPFKTDKQCEEEIDNIISGKNKSRNAWVVRRFIALHKKMGEPESFIRDALVREYKIKYGQLQKGKISLEELAKQSEAEIKQAANEASASTSQSGLNTETK